MPAKIVTLHDKENMIMYPETVIDAVHMPDGRRTLRTEIEQLEDDSSTTSFNQDGSITKVMTRSGMVITTEFGDGVITETGTYSDETPYYTKTTTFNPDGTITVLKEYADNTPTDDNEGSEGSGE